jgi:hypothetical protein
MSASAVCGAHDTETAIRLTCSRIAAIACGVARGNWSDDGEAAMEQDEECCQPADDLLFPVML